MTSLEEWFSDLLQRSDDRSAALTDAHTQLRNAGNLSKVTVQEYHCPRRCVVATVFVVGGSTLCAVRDYKLSPGLNETQSVEAARKKNTLDGDRHWPGHVFDLEALADWPDNSGIGMNCRHHRGLIHAREILHRVEGVRPGHKIKPHVLGVS